MLDGRVVAAVARKVAIEELRPCLGKAEEGHNFFTDKCERLLHHLHFANEQAKCKLQPDANAHKTPIDRPAVDRKQVRHRDDEQYTAKTSQVIYSKMTSLSNNYKCMMISII